MSSGDLVQQFEAHWTRPRLPATAAAERLYRIKDRAFETVAERIRDGGETTEYDCSK